MNFHIKTKEISLLSFFYFKQTGVLYTMLTYQERNTNILL
ncbi:hypothetical protein SC10_B2orf01219 [Bacillus paralicheniformis]|nr:hypothetical protein SC10_B2orf01219 [Bacillus paralicheniformis]